MSYIEKIIKKVLNEMNFEDMDEIIQFGEFAKLFSKSEMKLINTYLLKIRELGVVNMFQAGDFFLMSNKYFKDFMKLKSYEKEYDEELIDEISEMMLDVRSLLINAGVKTVENKNIEVTPKNVELAIKKIVTTIMKYYMKGGLPK
jgi:hypothetical protein